MTSVMSSVMSIDQARSDLLTLSLAQIVTQHQKLSLEMATIRGMRRELAVKGSAQVQKTAAVRRIEKRLGSRTERKSMGNLYPRNRGYGRRRNFPMKPLCLAREIQLKHWVGYRPRKPKGEAS
jgi:hypothetical protein